jgi:hypothetical protein
MSARRARVLERVGTLLRSSDSDLPERPAPPERDDDLRERVERLETVVEGLQDALYRHSQQEDERIAELQRRTQPENVARVLSDDARRRGI